MAYRIRVGRLLQPEPLEQMVSKNISGVQKKKNRETKTKLNAPATTTQQQRNPNMICALRTMHKHTHAMQYNA